MPLSRREFVWGGLSLPGLAAVKPGGARPSIALILVDYLPSWILSCYGGKDVKTPNIDRLSKTGLRLLNHCSASPAPGPGRASLLTGRTALQLKGAAAIPEGQPSIATVLSAAGYACGAAEGSDPSAVAGATAKFLDAQTPGKPFFVEAWFRGLTPPYEGVLPKHAALYAQAQFEGAFPSEPVAASARAGKDLLGSLLSSLRGAAAAITALDDSVGSIVAKITGRGLADETLVVFTSTCGGLYGRHGLWGAGEASDPPNMYQESVATPMIWSLPLRFPPQTTRPEGVGACDFLPSICEMTGVQAPSNAMCASSYLPLLTGDARRMKQPWRSVVFSHLGNTDMVRDSRYKLALRDGGKGPCEFFDLQLDPREKMNGYDDPRYTTIRAALTKEIANRRQTCAA